MGGKSGGGGGTQTTEPWSGQSPYLTDVFRQAQNVYRQGPQQYYPGSGVAPFSPQTQQAFDLTTQRALGGSPQQDALGGYITNTLGQGNVDPNQIAQGAGQAASSIGGAQQLLNAAGQPMSLDASSQFAGSALSPFTGALAGSTGYGSLGEASQFAGGPSAGALPASQQFVSGTLGQGGPSFGDAASQVASLGLGNAPDIGQLNTQFSANDLNPAAAGQLGATASGAFLGSNPFLDNVFDNAASRVTEQFNEEVMPGIAAQFGAAGRTGSGAQALTTGRAAGELTDSLSQLASDIYAPAYESERNRQTQAAGQLGQLGLGAGAQSLQAQGLGSTAEQAQQRAGLEAAGLGLQGGLAGLDAATNLYGLDLGQQLGAAQLGGDLFSRQNQAELGRLGQASDLYLGERGLGQSAAQSGGQLGLGGAGLAADLYNSGQGRQLQAGGALADLGLGGLGAMQDLYSNIGQEQFRAGSLVPQFTGLQYGDIDRLANVGASVEDQSQRLIDDAMNRWNFQQQQPWQQLGNYSNIINQLPSGLGSTTKEGASGSRLSGILGGASAGSSLGPWGALGGAVLGAFT